MIIAAAQTIPVRENIQQNISNHCKLIELAAAHHVQLLIFPELSLTGYEREHAEGLSFTPDDSRLKDLKELAVKYQMTVIAGAPIKLTTGLYIGSFIISPDHPTSFYTKQFLHDGEEVSFVAGNLHNPRIMLEEESFSLAICADLENPVHAENASKTGSTNYLASIFYTPNGIEGGLSKLKGYAEQLSFNVLMSNFAGESYGMPSAGKSSFWSNKGELLAQLNSSEEGLVIASRDNHKWSAQSIYN